MKNLQKLGLVERDIESRRYRAKLPVTEQVLFFNEVLEFIKTQFEKSVRSGNKRAGIILGPFGWFVMTDGTELSKQIENWLKDPKTINAMVSLSESIENIWNSYVLSQLDGKIRKTVEAYKDCLSEFAKIAYAPKSREALELLEPKNLKELYASIEMMEKFDLPWLPQEDLTEEERSKLGRIMEFLKNKENKQIYEGYLEQRNKTPKSLILYPSWGFKGYLKKVRDLIPKQGQ